MMPDTDNTQPAKAPSPPVNQTAVAMAKLEAKEAAEAKKAK
jgi:hypothetical protein